MWRLAFVLFVLAPMVVLQGRPDLAPAWLYASIGGTPVIVWWSAGLFAVLIGATWLPAPRE